MAAEDPVRLDLHRLPEDTELNRSLAETLALAASVVLDRLHGRLEVFSAGVHDGQIARDAALVPVLVGEVERASFADPQEATEMGGEAVGLLTARRVLNRIVFRRLPKHTGADYLMRDPALGQGDVYERLECSGIADGGESASSRLGAKIRQLARFPEGQSGFCHKKTDGFPEKV